MLLLFFLNKSFKLFSVLGEYITLYQKQRAILHQKSQDRDKAFSQVVEQRNQQQVQLHQLKVLVADLLKSQINCETSSLPSSVSQQDEGASSENHPGKKINKHSIHLLILNRLLITFFFV